MKTAKRNKPNKDFYNRQNRKIHKARAQLSMSLDDCRELARQIGGKPSISSLTLKQRWILIEELKAKGAKVYNPALPKTKVSDSLRETDESPKDVYFNRLAYWDKRFPRTRPGFASNEQLAWIQTMWELDFNDGRAGSSVKGLRGFIYRQTRNLKLGPVSDLTFLRSSHVSAVMSPLLATSQKKLNQIKEIAIYD